MGVLVEEDVRDYWWRFCQERDTVEGGMAMKRDAGCSGCFQFQVSLTSRPRGDSFDIIRKKSTWPASVKDPPFVRCSGDEAAEYNFTIILKDVEVRGRENARGRGRLSQQQGPRSSSLMPASHSSVVFLPLVQELSASLDF
ncbi:hypothetical protein Peur_055896 [Populus x canadensis]